MRATKVAIAAALAADDAVSALVPAAQDLRDRTGHAADAAERSK